MTVRLYGLSNCDQVRKARKWLEAESIAFEFVDFRKPAFTPESVQNWLTQARRDQIVNPASKAWKHLSETEQSDLMASDDQTFGQTLHAQPTLIKRPVLETDHSLIFRFNAEAYTGAFAK
ncbi:Spx/MgsR family RNA polymerase-binding regulatory protein [Thiomicrospira sp. WB1]|uniref:Spx/MgsR family RNA polymerase-binding regulatory protein n=1 Tax=Thiomicrospira sp. WB1 TaxID=1685380 RepID=UPI000745FF1C|nr:Spx/MgsR family RNA polymerase-binding regulatory protein [Thiomicrospira sp. WB1]KUJ72110.1 hypothetical protein AVO41_06665 [Thiomicrospira sp. WB1]